MDAENVYVGVVWQYVTKSSEEVTRLFPEVNDFTWQIEQMLEDIKDEKQQSDFLVENMKVCTASPNSIQAKRNHPLIRIVV